MGTVVCNNCRLVAQGFFQVFGEDYDQTYSPVAKFTSIQTLLAQFLFPRQNISKISKMEKSIIFASFLLFLSITTTFPKNCIYDTQISDRKLTCKTLLTAAGTFPTRAPPSFAKNSPPPQQFFDWFCRHKYKSKKLYSHIILFSPTISINLKYSLKSMPHSPANRAKRQRLSHQVNQVISTQQR